MTLTLTGWVLALLFAGWVGVSATIVIIDSRARRQHRLSLETRGWTEFVSTMRRLQDEEGEA